MTRQNARMRASSLPAAALAGLVALACSAPRPGADLAAPGNLLHAVYFDLAEGVDEEQFMRECRERLAPIPGVRSVEVAERGTEFTRPENAIEFDVALLVVLEDRAAHDGYQVHPSHQALVAEWRARIVRLAIFDAWVARD